MIDLITETAGTKKKPIIEWKVVFFVPPLGIFTKLNEAVQAASDLGLNPILTVMPISAAVTEDEMEVCFR